VIGLTGAERQVYGDMPWNDAAHLSAHGIPTVMFCPGGAGAHALEHADEHWLDLDSVQACADILLARATDFCA
jgi:acetylornithine deacetylase